jgi:hypothetical protein
MCYVFSSFAQVHDLLLPYCWFRYKFGADPITPQNVWWISWLGLTPCSSFCHEVVGSNPTKDGCGALKCPGRDECTREMCQHTKMEIDPVGNHRWGNGWRQLGCLRFTSCRRGLIVGWWVVRGAQFQFSSRSNRWVLVCSAFGRCSTITVLFPDQRYMTMLY